MNKTTTAICFAFLIASISATPLLGLLGGGGSSGGLPLVGGLLGGGSTGGSSTGGSSSGGSSIPVVGGLVGGTNAGNVLPGLLNLQILGKVLSILPLNGGLDGVLGQLINIVQLLLNPVFVILNQLLPILSTAQVQELTALLQNPNLTHSQTLQTIDGYLAGQPIELQTLYTNITKDVQNKVDAATKILTTVASGISPELGQLIQQLADVVQQDLTLLDANNAIGKLLSNVLANVDQLLQDLLADVQNLLNQLLSGSLLQQLGLDTLLSNLTGLTSLSGIVVGLLGPGNTGLLGSVVALLNNLLGGLLGGLGGGLLGGLGGGLLGGLL